jgi:hypothetical protein
MAIIQINPIWDIAQEGPGFNSPCKPPFPLPAPLGVNLFALDLYGVAFDRFYSEVVRWGIVDLT